MFSFNWGDHLQAVALTVRSVDPALCLRSALVCAVPVASARGSRDNFVSMEANTTVVSVATSFCVARDHISPISDLVPSRDPCQKSVERALCRGVGARHARCKVDAFSVFSLKHTRIKISSKHRAEK